MFYSLKTEQNTDRQSTWLFHIHILCQTGCCQVWIGERWKKAGSSWFFWGLWNEGIGTKSLFLDVDKLSLIMIVAFDEMRVG